MDKKPIQPSLLDRALQTAHKLGLQTKIVAKEPEVGSYRPDALLEIGYGNNRTRYAVEERKRLARSTVGPIIHHLKQWGEHPLLVTDHVTPPIAEVLRANGIAFLDAAGNAFLDSAPLFVWVKGEKPAAKSLSVETGRAFQPSGLQVLLVLLSKPSTASLPYRQLAAMAGVAHGTIGLVMADLEKLGYLRQVGAKRGSRRLFEIGRLMQQWAEGYARTLLPRTLIDRYYANAADWQTWAISPSAVQWGSEPAAALVTGYLRPEELTLYAESFPGPLAARLKLSKTASEKNRVPVYIRRRFWNFTPDDWRLDCTPPLLVYADLLATGDGRCIETARIIHDEYLARLV
jgi:hypothetical protein